MLFNPYIGILYEQKWQHAANVDNWLKNTTYAIHIIVSIRCQFLPRNFPGNFLPVPVRFCWKNIIYHRQKSYDVDSRSIVTIGWKISIFYSSCIYESGRRREHTFILKTRVIFQHARIIIVKIFGISNILQMITKNGFRRQFLSNFVVK